MKEAEEYLKLRVKEILEERKFREEYARSRFPGIARPTKPEKNKTVSEKYKLIREKWKIGYLFVTGHSENEKRLWGDTKNALITRKFEHNEIFSLRDFWNREVSLAWDGDRAEGRSLYPDTPFQCYLCNDDNLIIQLRVDLRATEKELSASFDKLIGEIKHRYCKNSGEKKIRKTKLDKWEIFDLQKSGLTDAEIVRKLKVNTNISEASSTPFKRVERAYKQAEKIIKAVQEDAERFIKKIEE